MKISNNAGLYSSIYRSGPVFQGKTDVISNEKIIAFLNSGKPIRKNLKAELGIALDTFYKLLRERGISYKKNVSKKTFSVTREDIENLQKRGYTIPQICETLKITNSKYYKLAEEFGIKSFVRQKKDQISLIKKEDLLRVEELNISVSEKCKLLGEISPSTYYSLLKSFEIVTQRQEMIKHNAQITEDIFVKEMKSDSKVKEKLKNLQISPDVYMSKLAEFGIKTKARENKEKIAQISKEQFLALYNETENVKDLCEILGIDKRTYTRLLYKFEIITDRKEKKDNISKITKEMLQDTVDNMTSVKDACNKLKITETTFYRLLKLLNIKYDYQHHSKEIVIPTEKLKEASGSGKKCVDIAKILGISVTSYHRKAKEKKVDTVFRKSLDKISSISKEELQKAIDSGMLVEDICKKFRITKSNYKMLIEKYNIQTMQRKNINKYQKLPLDEIMQRLEAGESPAKICEALDISKSTYRRIINSLKGKKSNNFEK